MPTQVASHASDIQKTEDYKIFMKIKGNRAIDPVHVRRLAAKMEEQGNLTQYFPIVVNEDMEVIDGQHRLKALRDLKWPVWYRVIPGLTVDTVWQINTGQKNWLWRDYAQHFADQNNEEYEWLLALDKKHGKKYSSSLICTLVGIDRKTIPKGIFAASIEKRELAGRLLDWLDEIYDVIGKQTGRFAQAMIVVMRSPFYNQARMLDKFSQRRGSVPVFQGIRDNLRTIEEIYNYHATETSRKRLF